MLKMQTLRPRALHDSELAKTGHPGMCNVALWLGIPDILLAELVRSRREAGSLRLRPIPGIKENIAPGNIH
jgi:hypothetical protein